VEKDYSLILKLHTNKNKTR